MASITFTLSKTKNMQHLNLYIKSSNTSNFQLTVGEKPENLTSVESAGFITSLRHLQTNGHNIGIYFK